MRQMLLYALFIAIASAASFSNTTLTTSTTTPSAEISLITSSASVRTTVPCLPDAGQVCWRTGQPTYEYGATNYNNPYTTPGWQNWTEAESSLSNYCADLFYTQMEDFLSTAPITYGSEIPLTTVYGGFGPATTEILDIKPVSYSTYWTTQTNYYIATDAGVTTSTYYVVNAAGFQVSKIETLDISLTSFTAGRNVAWTTASTETVTYPGVSEVVAWVQPAYRPAGFASQFTYSAEIPCCSACSLYGNKVEVYYWPTPAPSPAISTLLNAAGFTFISPSVYVAFQSLYATDMCGPVGSTIQATTIAIPNDELSTDIAYHWDTAEYSLTPPYLPPRYTKATWGNQTDCQDITTSYGIEDYVIGLNTAYNSNNPLPVYTLTYNPCSPTLSVPTEIFTLNPFWTACIPGINGLYDPPYPLTAGSGLSAFNAADLAQTTISSGPVIQTPVTPTSTAGPAPFLVAPTPTPTSTPSSTPADPAATPNDPPPAKSDFVAGQSNSPTAGNNDPAASTPSATGNDPPTNNKPPAQSPTGTSPASAPVPAIITLGSSVITANSASAFTIDSQTLSPGSEITHSGTVLFLDSSGSSLIIGSTTTQAIAHITPTSSYLVGTQTLLPGGPAITVSGTVLSLQADGSSIIANGATQPVNQFFGATPEFTIGTQTIKAGALAITISGTILSLQAEGSSVVVNGNTQPLASFLSTTAEYLVGTQKLKAGGPAITILGTAVSLMPDGSNVVVGKVTEALSVFLGSATTTVHDGLGGVIATIGGFTTQSTMVATSYLQIGGDGEGYNGTMFLGSGERLRRNMWAWGFLLGGALLGVGWL